MSRSVPRRREPPRGNQDADSDSDVDFCRRAFRAATSGESRGQLRTFDDFAQLVQRTGRNPSQEALRRHWEKYNSTRTGVGLEGFLAVCRQEPVTTREELLEAFNALDTNGDGYLSLDEFVAMLSGGGDPVPKTEARRLLQRYDRNKDGRLEYQEFIDFVLGDIEKSRRSVMRQSASDRRNVADFDNDDNKEEGEEEEEEEEAADRYGRRESPKPAPRRARATAGGGSGFRLGSERPPRPKPLKAPADLQRWSNQKLVGFHLLDEADGMRRVVSTHFTLKLPKATCVFVTMQPVEQEKLKTMRSECDLAFALFKDGRPVAVAENSVGSAADSVVVGLKGDFEAGEYQLLPYCSGEKLQLTAEGRKQKSAIKKDNSGKYRLTTAVKDALEDVFFLCDVRQDGVLDREEFQFYSLITSDEEVDDELWGALAAMVPVKDDSVDLDAFVDLNRQEVEGDNWSDENLWINLKSFGVNSDLLMTGAFAFEVAIHCAECRNFDVDFHIPLKFPQNLLLRGVADFVKERGSSLQCNDCLLHCLETPLRIFIAGEKEGSAVPTTVSLDVSGSYGIDDSEEKKTLFVRRTNSLLLQLVPTTPTYKFAALATVE